MFWGPAKIDNLWIFKGQEAELSEQSQSTESEEVVTLTDYKGDGESMDGVDKGEWVFRGKTRKIAWDKERKGDKKGIKIRIRKRVPIWELDMGVRNDGAEDSEQHKRMKWWDLYLLRVGKRHFLSSN